MALRKEVVVMEGVVVEGAALTVRVRALIAACAFESVTLTVNFLVPVPVGVPEMAPVFGASARPAGKDPDAMAQVYGVVPPEAASVAL